MPAKRSSPSPPGQIPAPDAAGKKNVAADEEFVLAREKTEAARTMPRHFENLEVHPEKVARRRRLDQEIGLDRLDLELEPEIEEEIRVGDHRRAVGMNADRATEALFDFGHVLDVIDMPVGEEEEPQLDPFPLEPVAGAVGRIEEDPALRRLEGVAVRLKDSAGKSLVFHRRVIAFLT